MARELTPKEIRDRFIYRVAAEVRYWLEVPESRCPPGQDLVDWRVKSVAYSILMMLDGCTDLPRFLVAPDPHPDDREFDAGNGEDWFPENDASDVKANIAGSLHDDFICLIASKAWNQRS